MEENYNINDAMTELKEKFERIKEKEWIKSVCGGRGDVGLTFETELGIKHNSLEMPDYKGIEIKTKRVFSEYPTGLFNAVPNGSFDGVVNYLNDFYGYPMKNNRKFKCLNNDVKATKYTKIGTNYYFKLSVDWKEKIIKLNIYNKYFKLIQDDIYWDFDYIIQKLENKLHYLAFVKCFKKVINEEKFFRYASLDFYELNDPNKIFELVESGDVTINIKISSHTEGEFIGESYSHGFTFRLQEKEFVKLFKKIKI